MDNKDTADGSEKGQKEKARATPGKMTTYLGEWKVDEDVQTVFCVKAVIADATPAKIREALLKLGPGTYTKLVCREDTVSFVPRTVNSFKV